MVFKKNTVWLGALLCIPSVISANITTLQYWDPAPFFNAANLNMPPDTQFCYGVKKRMLDENANEHQRWGINVSPFVQRAIRVQKADNVFFGVHGNTTLTPGLQMSDYQGTPFLMGLFLGQDVDGNSIWGDSASIDTGSVTNITTTTVNNTLLPTNLKNAVNALNDNVTAPTYTNAIIETPTTSTANTSPSILSQSVLDTDKIYFGAFSTPLTYQKAGFRWELNFDFSDSIGFIARGGFCQITQRVTAATDLSSNSDIYSTMATVSVPTAPSQLAQSTFNEWVPNNIDDLLASATSGGVDYDITTFADSGLEDIQFLGFIRHAFTIHPKDPNQYASMIVTPYAMIGWTVPIAPEKDYSKLYALPFGNNGHTSVGGVVGLTFDFIDSIEFGFEFGATGFLQQTISAVPCPNHPLQRVIYPYRQDVYYSPGFNGQFAAIFNAYEFAQNTSFSIRYNYIQHNQDTITLTVPSDYFFPSMLEELSPWTSQMFIAALTFEIQPSVFMSIAWQGALSQKNAYCSNTILGSLNFQF